LQADIVSLIIFTLLICQIFETINKWLKQSGGVVKEGSSIEATIIEAPSSTKNKFNQRDPELHQTKKGNQRHLGMKAHIGFDVKSWLIHTFTTIETNEHDLNQAYHLLHSEEDYVFADSGSRRASKREELNDIKVDWYIA
jgi:IS5 family transposase